MLTLRRRGANRGFTLIEMMVAMALGLILTGAVTGLVVASMSNTNATVQGMRVTEESRAITEIITRELRRVRYNANSMRSVGSGATLTTFSAITPSTVNVASDCIKYSYDYDGNGAASAGEFRMFSRTVESNGKGVVRFGKFDSAGAVSCTGGSIISSPDIDITCLRFISATSNTTMNTSSAAACILNPPVVPVSLATIPAGSLYFSLRMSLKTDGTTTTSRRTDEMIMLRSPSVGP